MSFNQSATTIGMSIKKLVPFVLFFMRRVRVSLVTAYYGRTSLKVHPSASVSLRAIIRMTDGGAIRIGPNTVLHAYSLIDSCGGTITIDANCSLNPFSVIYGHGGVSVGQGTRIATHTVIVSANHQISRNIPIIRSGVSACGITIGPNVWIGAGAKVLDGTNIGAGSVVGAGAVVTKNIPIRSLAIGVPAKSSPLLYR